MNQVKARKFISFGIAVLFALSGLLVLFPISVHASKSVTVNLYSSFGSSHHCYIWNMDSGTSTDISFYGSHSFTFNFDFNVHYRIRFSSSSGIFYPVVSSSIDGDYGSSSYAVNYGIPDSISFTVGYDSASESTSRFNFTFVDLLPTPTPTLTPTPTASPSPTPSPTPSVDTFFSPFKSFAGTYFEGQALFFPNSVTKHQYAQYSGIVADHDMSITDIRSSLQYNAGDYVVYKFEYDILPLTSADFRFDFLFDSDSDLPSVYVSYLLNGQVYECDDFEQTYLTGIYTQYGAFDIDPTQTLGPPYYSWEVDLSSQRSLGVEIEGLKHDNTSVTPITITLYISSSPMPNFGSSFDWAQLFQDTRPDSAFLTTVSSLSSLPFFVGGLGFLALGAVIGIVLKFMR